MSTAKALHARNKPGKPPHALHADFVGPRLRQSLSSNIDMDPHRTAQKVIAMYGEHALVFCSYMADKFSSDGIGYRYWLAVANIIDKEIHNDAQ
jgi:hypothetical protein